jgi:hypothetical protein
MEPRTENASNRRCALVVSLLLATLLIAPSSTASDESDSEDGIEAFRIVIDRNIFNRNRKPAPRPGSTASARQESATSRTGDRFSLVGALIDEFGAVAFFSGSKPEYQGVTKQGGSIAGYSVDTIETGRILLKRDGAETVLAVGASMERDNGGEWVLRESANPAQVYTDPSAPSDSAETSTGDSDSASEVRRRMIERRKRETNP